MHLTAIPALKFNQIKGLFKVLLIMKIMLLLMLAFVAQAFAAGNAQVVTLSENNTTPKSVLAKIELQTGYYFWYENTLMDKIGPISVKFKKLPLKDALNLCFADQPVTYEIINRTILLKPGKIMEAFREITGIIRDSAGTLLGGANIAIKGTKKQTISDANGRFSIEATDGDILVVSFVGYESTEVLINTGQNHLDIVLQKTTRENENIVVTALGIKRQEKALAYNLQRVTGEELTRNKDANFVNSLAGKIAGVTINASAAGIGGATRVVMRGTKSISGNNNALYVIDGIPVLNSTDLSTNKSAGQISDIFSANTGTDIMSTINPEDIETISVLTGASGTALYGKDGQNGVIIINTKSGRKDNKTSLGLVNNTMYYTPLVMPEFQNTYGQTDEGSSQSWGPKLSTPSDYNPRDFFQTGNNTTVGLNFSTGTEKNQTYLAADMVRANGIIPNNTLKRYNISARNTTNFLNNRFTLDINTRYSYQNEKNMVAQGLYHNPLVPIYLFPPGGNIEAVKIYERYNPTRLFPTQYWPFLGDQFRTENPWWIVNRESVESISRRLLFTASLKYNLFSWMNITARGTVDHINRTGGYKRHASTDQLFAGYGGAFSIDNSIGQRLYGDLMVNINKTWGDYGLTATIGGQRTEDMANSNFTEYRIPEGSPPNVFTTDIGTGIARQADRISYQSLFATTALSYRNMLFLEGSYRVDWDSRLYFNSDSKLNLTYPSVGASAILSDLFKLKSDVVSFIKIRGSYGAAGNAPRSYIGGPQTFNLSGGRISQYQPLHLPLQPERTNSWEAGTSLKFLHNKISLDITLYSASTIHQIFEVAQSVTGGGYSSFYLNAGKVNNRGIEGTLGYAGNLGPVHWNSNTTYTLNKNTVKALYNTVDANGNNISIPYLDLAGGGSYLQRAKVGRSLSSIYTTAQLKLDEKGYVMLPLSVDASSTNPVYVGNADPKYTLGWNNGFTYKNFSLNFLIFARIGGVGVSATQAMMDAYGVSKTTADARDRGNVMINGYPYNDIQNYYTQMGSGLNGVLGYYVYSATNVRLKELSLAYTIPGKLLGNWVKGVKLAVTGNNLFMFYNKAPFDPESTASSGTYYQGFDYFRQPSLRGIGFSINAQF